MQLAGGIGGDGCWFGRPQVLGHGRKHRLRQHAGQQLHQPPGHGQLVQRRLAGHRACTQHLAVGAPDKTPRQLHPRRSAHPGLARHLHLQPLGHAAALHQHHFFLEGLQRVAAQPGDEGLRQVFRAVTVQNNESGREGMGHGKYPGAVGSGRTRGDASTLAKGSDKTCRTECGAPSTSGGAGAAQAAFYFFLIAACAFWTRARAVFNPSLRDKTACLQNGRGGSSSPPA